MKVILLPVAWMVLFAQSVFADTVPPLITAAAVSSSSVDISGGEATVTVTLTITDDASGFESGNLFLYNPSGGYVNNVHFTGTHRVSGSAPAGSYEVTVTVPEFGAPGTWRGGIPLAAGANGFVRLRFENP